MANFSSNSAREFYAQTYDVCVKDWPGEIAFYAKLAANASSQGRNVLELACGTGRVAIRLAEDGANVVGVDFSSAMLRVAQQKSQHLPNTRWIEADMRSFDLGVTFGLSIIPGH